MLQINNILLIVINLYRIDIILLFYLKAFVNITILFILMI